ncbi:MAG TPA: protein kinase [Thermoanaerobaculia bacterium]
MIGTTLNHYRIVKSLGSGGMGDVYAADDTRLGRRIALKVLPPSMAADRARLTRFEREARAVAALNHPNVVTIYSVEQAGEVHFLTMELVEGKTLTSLIPPEGLPLRDLLRIAIPLTEAIAAAHRAGIVHRDLKPANVMLGADGRLKVLDFGIAKLSAREVRDDTFTASTLVNVTAEHNVIGTAAYMSPEQAEGKTVDHRSDIFSLGVILYELATGSRPFRGESTASLISSILRDEPPPPSEVRAIFPRELDRIVARCLAKDPDRRFQSALDLRNELEELHRDVTVERPPAGATRRLPVMLAGFLALALVAGIAAILFVIGKGSRMQPAPPFRAKYAQLTSAPGQELFPTLSPDGKWFAYVADASGNRDIYLQSVGGLRAINLTPDSPADDTQPAFSPDGERIAFRSSRDGGGLFVMGRTGEAVRRLTDDGFNPSWSPDGTQIVYATEGMEIAPLNWERQSHLWIVPVDGGAPRRIVDTDSVQPNWSPNGQRILFVSRGEGSSGARQVDLRTAPLAGGPSVALTNDPATDWNPVWAADGKHVYFSSDRGGSMNLWRLAIDEATGEPRGEPEPITTPAVSLAHIAVSRDGSRIAYASILQAQNIQRVEMDRARGTIRGEPFWVTTGSRLWSSPDPSPDGEWIAFYSRERPEGDLYVIRKDGTALRQVTSDPAIDRVPRWSPDGKWIAHFSNREGPLQIWKVRPDGSDLQRVSGKEEAGIAVWSSDGSKLIVSSTMTGRQAGTPHFSILDPSKRGDEQKPRVIDCPGPYIAMAWSPDGKRIAAQVGWLTKGIVIYSLDAGTFESVIDYGEWPFWLDDRRIMFVNRGKEFLLLDTKTRKVTPIFAVPRDVIGPPRVTRDGSVYFSRRVTEADIWMATLETGDDR